MRRDQIFLGKASGVGNPVIYVGAKHWLAPAIIFVLFALARALFGWFGAAASTPCAHATSSSEGA